MCIHHGMTGMVSGGFVKEDRPKKHIKKVSQKEFEKGDPNFVDERKTIKESQSTKNSLFSSFFKG